jgi:histidine triad (HIT) family protein
MSLTGAYEDDNIFARLIRGEIPSVKVFETGEVMAFMDAFPQSKGHCLVVSKTAKARNLLDMDAEPLCDVVLAAQRLTRAVVAALKPDGVRVAQFNGTAAGQTVFHTHIHVIPVWDGVPLARHGGDMADAGELRALAEQIAAKLA